MLGFHCLLRTGELLAAKVDDFQFDVAGGTAILNLHVTKGGARRAQQEVVTIDDAILVRWLATILDGMLPGDPLIDLSQQKFRALFADLCRTLRLTQMSFKPYSLRRGGATYHYRRFGNLDRTALRGRWACLRTARIYITDGVATQQEIRYTSEHKALFLRFRGVLMSAASHQQGRVGTARSSRRAAPPRAAAGVSCF